MDVDRLDMSDVDATMLIFHKLRNALVREWSEESLKYEGEINGLPRRNFMNEGGRIHDTSLYPYDPAFYPLLDAYDQLYLNQKHDPYARLVKIGGTSNESLFRPFGTNYSQGFPVTEFDEEEEALVLRTSAAARASIEEAFILSATTSERHEELIEALLKILCHASSDLQRDLFLATDVFSFILHNLIDDQHTRVFMRVFVTIDLFFDQWTSNVHEGSILIEQGLTYFYENFAGMMERLGLSTSESEALASFVRWTFVRHFQPTSSNLSSFSEKPEQQYALVPSNEVPIQLVCFCCRVVMSSLWFKESVLFDTTTNFSSDGLERFSNCINVLLSFGLSALQILRPRDNMGDDGLSEFRAVGSSIVLALYLLLARMKTGGNGSFPAAGVRKLLLSAVPREWTSRNPLCFANRILHATSEGKAKHMALSGGSSTSEEFKRFFQNEPPRDILEVVKGLFLRGLVDPMLTGFGYGEFLLWTGYQVKAGDGMVFCKFFNLPMDREDEESDDDEEEEATESDMKGAKYERDEYDDHDMTLRELSDRHDLAMLLFLRSIQEPWNPESHASFSPQFRQSVKTIWMCTRHKVYPMDIARRLCSFLGRDWWPDATIECWNFECRNQQAEIRALAFYERRQPAHTIVSSTCHRCKIPYYCNFSCRREAFDDGHKENCTKMPFSAGKMDAQERQLYVDILGDLPSFLSNPGQSVETSGSFMDVEAEANDGDVDEESSWETIGSDEDIGMANDSPTMIVSRFFAKSRRKKTTL